MQNLRNVLRQNCLLLASLKEHPTRLRVNDEASCVLPRLSHDNRQMLVSIQRQFTSDSREAVCRAIEVTVGFLLDLKYTDYDFIQQQILPIKIEPGLHALSRFYLDDINVALCRDNCTNILNNLRNNSPRSNLENLN